jgi:hypothetical protein
MITSSYRTNLRIATQMPQDCLPLSQWRTYAVLTVAEHFVPKDGRSSLEPQIVADRHSSKAGSCLHQHSSLHKSPPRRAASLNGLKHPEWKFQPRDCRQRKLNSEYPLEQLL